MNKYKIKKIISLFLITVVFVSSIGPIFPKKADAQFPFIGLPTEPLPSVPVSDAAQRSKEVGVTAFGVTFTGITFDSFMIMLARALIDKMGDAVVDWINTGFDGGPAFAVNPQDFFLGIGDKVAGDFLKSIGLGGVCSPFRDKVLYSVELLYSNSRTLSRDPYEGSCTLSGALGNIDSFLSGTFSQGGWRQWYNLTQTTQGNPYTSALDAQAGLSLRIEKERETEATQLDWGKGFLSWSECEEWSYEDFNTGEVLAEPICARKGPTKTPGTVIESQLEDTLGTELSQLELADEFDEIAGALVGFLVGRVFNSGSSAGLINSSAGSWVNNGYGGIRGVTSPFGSCSPDKLTGIVGDQITWKFTGGANNQTISWSGSEGLSGSSDTVTITYQNAGKMSATVTVTRTIIQDGNQVTQTGVVQCQGPVDISRYAPLAVSCTLRPPYTVREGELVTWEATITGGSGKFSRITWIGDNPIVDFKLAFPQWPLIPITQANGVTTVLGPRIYDEKGTMSAQITVIDADSTVRPATDVRCTDSVLVY